MPTLTTSWPCTHHEYITNSHGTTNRCAHCGKRSQWWNFGQLQVGGPVMGIIASYSDSEIDIATDQAMVTLLWQAGDITNEEGNYAGRGTWEDNYDVDDFPESQRAAMRAKLAAFMEAHLEDLVKTGHNAGIENNVQAIGRIGHDYVLTTAGHGAGFWDRGYGEAGDRLTEACKAERAEWYLMETDNGISCLELED